MEITGLYDSLIKSELSENIFSMLAFGSILVMTRILGRMHIWIKVKL